VVYRRLNLNRTIYHTLMRRVLVLLLTLALLLQVDFKVEAELPPGMSYGVVVYEDKGYPVLVKIHVASGTGVVRSNIRSFDPLFNLSLTLAVYEAMLGLGLDPWSYDVYVELVTDPRITVIVGPSLGLPVFLATYSLLTNTSLPANLMSTGAVSLDSLVLYVGYIYVKGEAARRYNFTYYMIPLLQNVTLTTTTRFERLGPYVYEVREVRFESIGLERLNLSVLQVSGLHEAFNISLNLPLRRAPSLDELYRVMLVKSALPKYRVDLITLIVNFTSKDLSRDISRTWELLTIYRHRLPRDLTGLIEESLLRAESLLNLSGMLKRNGTILASLEALTQAYMEARYARYTLTMFALGDIRLALAEALGNFESSQNLLFMSRIYSPDHLLSLGFASYILRECDFRISMLLGALEVRGWAPSLFVARELAWIDAMSFKARAFIIPYIVERQFNLEARIINVASKYVDYIVRGGDYTWYYSVATGITSPMLTTMSSYMYTASRLNEANATPTAIAYALEGISHGLTTLALAPNLTPLIEARLESLTRTIGSYVDCNQRVPLMAIYYMELALLQERPESRLLALEKVLAYVKAFNMIHRMSGVGEDVYETLWSMSSESGLSMGVGESVHSSRYDLALATLTLIGGVLLWLKWLRLKL
jgi:hypothetical protein